LRQDTLRQNRRRTAYREGERERAVGDRAEQVAQNMPVLSSISVISENGSWVSLNQADAEARDG
jgi:hypothetical protein